MARGKFDGLIEAVRYHPDGTIDLLRLYERRGPTFSDRVIYSRQQLVDALENGKKFVTGSRKPLLGSTFDVHQRVYLAKDGPSSAVIATSKTASAENLSGTPRF